MNVGKSKIMAFKRQECEKVDFRRALCQECELVKLQSGDKRARIKCS